MAKTKGGSLKLDFSEVEASSFAIPNGGYVLSVTSVEKKRSESSGNEYLSWEFKIAEGKHKGKKVWDNTSLQPQALWRLRNLFEAMGVEIEDGEVEVDLDDLEGETVGAEIENEKYQGKDKARVTNFITVDDVTVGEEAPAPKKAAPAPAAKPAPAKKADPTPEPEEEEEEEEEAPPPPVAKKKKAAPAPAFEVGQKVSFEDDGEEFTGKITAIVDDTVTVKVGKDEWELSLSEIKAA